ncbi:minor capsid protein [Streptomyces sp. NPDC057217]|uniref:minor capsid protein n=1 Tax=Streptomyces sp. NPDC057217 TaxID=3346054 RepID=UPI0036439E63
MSHTRDLLDGYARLLAEAGVGIYRENGIYTATETGITITAVPDTPDRILCLTPYDVDSTSGGTDMVEGLQVRIRTGTDPRPVLDLEDQVFGLLHMREHTTVGGVHVALSWRQSWSWIGADARRRQELTANYYLRVSRTSPHLID